MSRCHLAALVAAAAVASPFAASAQTVLYDQPAASPLIQQAPFANVNETFSGQLIADNFTLAEDALVGTVQWWGTTAHRLDAIETADLNLAAFRIQIFADDGVSTLNDPGMPGTVIAEEDIAIDDIITTPGEPGPYTGGPTLFFSASFSSPVALQGGHTYWVAINAILADPNDPHMFVWFAEAIGAPAGDGFFAEEGHTSPRDGIWRKVGIGTAVEPGFRIIAVDAVDTDGDGLLDDDEVALYGTDPNNPDTDGDGLLDGTEIDLAANGSCVDPLDADSDNDGLLDGAEAVIGTSPCNMDTDADGIFDPIDANPVEPNASGDLENAIRTVAEQIDALPLDAMLAPNGNAAAGRRNSMSSRIHSAANNAANGNYNSAIALLSSVYGLIDGDPSRKDWLAEDEPQKAELAMYISSLMQALSQP